MNGDTPIPWRCGAYFSTGRDALCALLADICARPAADCVLPVPRRLWLPGYYCPDVVGTLLPLALAVPLELRTYPAPPPGLPDLARIPLAPGDLLLLVNLFGLHGASTTPRLPPGVVLIEDHTHDPLSRWARTSTADWCFASLRKTLPLPDGGVVWSPGGRALPRPPVLTLQRRLASLEMLAAMTLRSAQPSGATAAPETIRACRPGPAKCWRTCPWPSCGCGVSPPTTGCARRWTPPQAGRRARSRPDRQWPPVCACCGPPPQ